MDFKLKPKIFEYFGMNAKVLDTYKDLSGKGINERFNEACGETYDDELSDLIDNLIDRTIVPKVMLSKLIPLMEYMLGNPVILTTAVPMRRKIIKFAQHLYNVKSTRLSYEMLFNLLGFDTTVVEEFVITSGFDSDVTLDDEFRMFDGSERCCSEYSVHLTGSIVLTSVMIEAILRVIKFLEPINADLRQITYNGEVVLLNLITIYVEDGNQFYNNTNDPGLTLVLQDGNLYKDGPSAGNYVMIDGYLYYQT